MKETHGLVRERRVRQIAAELGVADFVFTCPPVRKGTALREASGDGLLIVGDLGAVLQVKACEPDRAAVDTPEKAARWLRKHIKIAEGQGRSAKHEIDWRTKAGDALSATPARALALTVGEQARYQLRLTADVVDWPSIIVVVHPHAFGVEYEVGRNVFVITLDDWSELHRRLRSTHHILAYVKRVLSDDLRVPLGGEHERYNALCEADLSTDDGSPTWVPALPSPNYTGGDGQVVFRQIQDRVWPVEAMVPWNTPEEYRKIVEVLDRVPGQMQEELGERIIRYWREVAASGTRRSGWMLVNKTIYLQVMCRTTLHLQPDDNLVDIASLAHTRQVEAMDTGAPPEFETLGIGILNDAELGTVYAFAYVSGRPEFPNDIRQLMESQYGRFDYSRSEVIHPDQS